MVKETKQTSKSLDHQFFIKTKINQKYQVDTVAQGLVILKDIEMILKTIVIINNKGYHKNNRVYQEEAINLL